jgi:hypothetical protein
MIERMGDMGTYGERPRATKENGRGRNCPSRFVYLEVREENYFPFLMIFRTS